MQGLSAAPSRSALSRHASSPGAFRDVSWRHSNDKVDAAKSGIDCLWPPAAQLPRIPLRRCHGRLLRTSGRKDSVRGLSFRLCRARSQNNKKPGVFGTKEGETR